MSEEFHYCFKLNQKAFKLPSRFKHRKEISDDITECLIFRGHEYDVQSNVSEEVFQSFVNYLIDDTPVNITRENFLEFLHLSKEFEILGDVIESKKLEFGACFVNISSLKDQHGENTAFYEEEIATSLDMYLDQHGSELMDIPIQSLYRIFTHKSLKLKDHDLAYTEIKKSYERSGNKDIFILLDTLDGLKLSEENLIDSFREEKERCNHIPRVDFAYVSSLIGRNKTLEEKIASLGNQMSEEKKNHQQELIDTKQNLSDEHSREISRLEEEHSAEMQRKCEEHESAIKALKEEHSKKIESIKDQCSKSISDNNEKHKKEVEKIKNEKLIEINRNREENKTAIEKLKDEHLKEIKDINDKHSISMNSNNEKHAKEIADLQQKHSKELQKERKEHENAMNSLKGTHYRELKDMEYQNLRDINDLNKKHTSEIEKIQQEQTNSLQRYCNGHETAMNALKEAHLREIGAIKDKNSKDINDLNNKHAREIADIRREQSIQLQQNRQENENLVKVLKDSHSKEIKSIKDKYSKDINGLNKNHAREIADIRREQSIQLQQNLQEYENLVKALKDSLSKEIKSFKNKYSKYINEKEIADIQQKNQTETNNAIRNLHKIYNDTVSSNPIRTLSKEQQKESQESKEQNKISANISNSNQPKEKQDIEEQNSSSANISNNNQPKENQNIQENYSVSEDGSIFVKQVDYKPGIYSVLKTRETTIYDRLAIASSSSSDIYNIIDPNTQDFFSSSSKEKFTITMKFKKPIEINSAKIFSSTKNFPKSFKLYVDNKPVKEIQSANKLNQINGSTILEFQRTNCSEFSFVQTGRNWDNKECFDIKRIELLSSLKSPGIFEKLISQSEDKDPHKCPVFISASDFDFNSFYNILSGKRFCTGDFPNSWFQIEFTEGLVSLTGFRLKLANDFQIKSFKIICTDDVRKSEDSWINVYESREEAKNDFFKNRKFKEPTQPVRYVRLVQTGPNHDGNNCLCFCYFDVFGRYTPNPSNEDQNLNLVELFNEEQPEKKENADPGIFFSLKTKETSPFDPIFIASSSSSDIYNIIDPKTVDYYSSSSSSGYLAITIRFKDKIIINCAEIFSSTKNFPMSFDLFVDQRKVSEIASAENLKNMQKSILIQFHLTAGKEFKFVQTGPSWSNNACIDIWKIELFNKQRDKFTNVFKQFISKNANPHKWPVSIESTCSGFNSFYNSFSNKIFSTNDKPNSWFQVELTKGLAVLNGFKLRIGKSSQIRSFKIICTDDVNKPKEWWIKAYESKNEPKDDFVKNRAFVKPTPPVKYIRLVQTGPNYDNDNCLRFCYFDVYGEYTSNERIEGNNLNFKCVRDPTIYQTSDPIEDGAILDIFATLKERELSSFDRLFIASSSSSDIYNLIDPQTKDYYSSSSSSSSEYLTITMEFKDEIEINCAKIFSSTKNFVKAFDLFVDQNKVKEIAFAGVLNKVNGEFKAQFGTIKGKEFKFVQTSSSWDNNSCIDIWKIVLINMQNGDNKNALQKFISENKDPHTWPIVIKSSCSDFSSFYKSVSNKIFSTNDVPNSWFQVELTKGLAVLTGFRLRIGESSQIRSFKIICTDDVNKPEESWIKAYESKNEPKDKLIKNDIFENPTPPVRYIRLVQTGPNYDNNNRLSFYYFDVIGRFV